MSKKRGLSMEDKREQLLQIFYESQDFYLLRELEKLGPRKGVISQTVKDVLQSLVDDDLVFKDKIGTSVYFWSLPSRAGHQLRQVQAKLEADHSAAKSRRAELEMLKESTKKGREASDEREQALANMRELELQHKVLKEELDQYADNDPSTVEAMRTATLVAHQSVNRWTDNIFSLQNWCNQNFPEAKERLQQAYREAGIDDDFDYLD